MKEIFMNLCLQLEQRKTNEAESDVLREEYQQRISSAERKASFVRHVFSYFGSYNARQFKIAQEVTLNATKQDGSLIIL